jgi:hypothetical protein
MLQRITQMGIKDMNEITAYNLHITDDFIEILNESSFTFEKNILSWDEVESIIIGSRGAYSPPYLIVILKKESIKSYEPKERYVKNLLFTSKKKGDKLIQFFENLKDNFPEKNVVKKIDIQDTKKRIFLIRINIYLLSFLLAFSVMSFFGLLLSKHWNQIVH